MHAVLAQVLEKLVPTQITEEEAFLVKLRDQKLAADLVKLGDQLTEKVEVLKDAHVANGEDPQHGIAERASYEETLHQVSQVLFVFALVMNLRSHLRSGGISCLQHALPLCEPDSQQFRMSSR